MSITLNIIKNNAYLGQKAVNNVPNIGSILTLNNVDYTILIIAEKAALRNGPIVGQNSIGCVYDVFVQ